MVSERYEEAAFGELLSEPVRNGVYKSKEFHGRGCKIVNMGELFAYPRLFDVPMRRVELSDNEKQKSLLKAGDLLFARRSLVAEGAGKCSIVKETNEPTTFESSIIRARPDISKASSDYLYYFFSSELGRQALGTILRQVAVSGITGTDLVTLRLPCPPLSIQKCIAEILSAIDDKIELNRRMNATLEQMAQALFKSWFVDFDPVKAKAEGRTPEGMDADTATLFPDRFEDSELGEIPAGWGTGSILTQANLLSGGTPKTEKPEYWNGNVPWASAKDVSQARQTFLVITERTITSRGLEESATQLIPALGTVIVARGATTGRMALLGQEMAMNQTCYALVSSIGTPLALHCQLRQAIDALVHAAHGSVFDTITTSTFSTSKIVIPPAKTLRVFEQIVSSIFGRILTATEECVSLAALRDTLLPKLISGQLRIPEAEAMAAGEL